MPLARTHIASGLAASWRTAKRYRVQRVDRARIIAEVPERAQ